MAVYVWLCKTVCRLCKALYTLCIALYSCVYQVLTSVLTGDSVYFGVGGTADVSTNCSATLHRLDKATGAVRWKVRTGIQVCFSLCSVYVQSIFSVKVFAKLTFRSDRDTDPGSSRVWRQERARVCGRLRQLPLRLCQHRRGKGVENMYVEERYIHVSVATHVYTRNKKLSHGELKP